MDREKKFSGETASEKKEERKQEKKMEMTNKTRKNTLTTGRESKMTT